MGITLECVHQSLQQYGFISSSYLCTCSLGTVKDQANGDSILTGVSLIPAAVGRDITTCVLTLNVFVLKSD